MVSVRLRDKYPQRRLWGMWDALKQCWVEQYALGNPARRQSSLIRQRAASAGVARRPLHLTTRPIISGNVFGGAGSGTAPLHLSKARYKNEYAKS